MCHKFLSGSNMEKLVIISRSLAITFLIFIEVIILYASNYDKIRQKLDFTIITHFSGLVFKGIV